MRFGLMMVAALFGAPVAAQDLPSLSEVTAEIDGREVQVSGALMEIPRGAIFSLHLEGGETFIVKPALAREDLAALNACVAEGPCQADISAEVEVDGADIGLIAYEVRFK